MLTPFVFCNFEFRNSCIVCTGYVQVTCRCILCIKSREMVAIVYKIECANVKTRNSDISEALMHIPPPQILEDHPRAINVSHAIYIRNVVDWKASYAKIHPSGAYFECS